MKNSKSFLLFTCSLGLFALPAALSAGDSADKHFKMMDADSDGKITRAEHVMGAKQMFTKNDANSDGMVTAAEMDAAMASKEEKSDKYAKTSAQKIKEIDTNNDGQLTAAEHEAGTEKMFMLLDKNADGSVSKEEFHDGKKEMKHDKK